MILHGTAITGLGEATALTQLPWVVSQIEAKLGMNPYPGTFNIRLSGQGEIDQWEALKASPGIPLQEPTSSNCAATCYSARLNDELPGAILLPDVPGYPADQVEVIAAVHVRAALRLKDGDPITIDVRGSYNGLD